MSLFPEHKFLRNILKTTDPQQLLKIKNSYSCNPVWSLTVCYDLEEIVFNRLNAGDRKKVLAHIAKYCYTPESSKTVHIMSDIDDTVFSSRLGGSDVKFKHQTVYPGLKHFYQETLQLSFLTLLSARPKFLEKPTRNKLQSLLAINLNMLSGNIEDLINTQASEDEVNDVVVHCNTVELCQEPCEKRQNESFGNYGVTYPTSVNLTPMYENKAYFTPLSFGESDVYPSTIDHISGAHIIDWYRQYRDMGVTKFKSIQRFVSLYPEYKIIFIGDSGQGDMICAYLLNQEKIYNSNFPVICSYIHNILKEREFWKLKNDFGTRTMREYLMISEKLEADLAGHGIYMFQNYIEVALHMHSLELLDKTKVKDFAAVTYNEFETETRYSVYQESSRLTTLLRDNLKDSLSLTF